MEKTKKKFELQDKHIFILYMLLFLGAAVTLALMQPFADTPPWYGNPPDEPSRFKVAQFICKYGRLPNGFDPEIRIAGYGVSYGFYTMRPILCRAFSCGL